MGLDNRAALVMVKESVKNFVLDTNKRTKPTIYTDDKPNRLGQLSINISSPTPLTVNIKPQITTDLYQLVFLCRVAAGMADAEVLFSSLWLAFVAPFARRVGGHEDSDSAPSSLWEIIGN